MLRLRRATVMVADAERGMSRISRESGGESISQLRGKHCSHRLQRYNVPALKEIKWKKGNIDLGEQELQSWQQPRVNTGNASTAASWGSTARAVYRVCSWEPIRQTQPIHWSWLQMWEEKWEQPEWSNMASIPPVPKQNHQKPPQSHTRWMESQGSPSMSAGRVWSSHFRNILQLMKNNYNNTSMVPQRAVLETWTSPSSKANSQERTRKGIKTLNEQPAVPAQNHLQQIASSTRVHKHTSTYTHITISRSHSQCYRMTLRHYFWFLLSQHFNSHLKRKYCTWNDTLGPWANYLGTGVSDSTWNRPHSMQPFSGKASSALLEKSEIKTPRGCWPAPCKTPLLSHTEVILELQVESAHNCLWLEQRLSLWTNSRSILKC